MFRMLGKKVELIRYKVTWQEDEQEMQEVCISEGHKNEVEQSLTAKNIIPSCKRCNSSKSNKDFFEWYPQYEYYSKENENFILSYLGYKQKYSNQAPYKALLLCPE